MPKLNDRGVIHLLLPLILILGIIVGVYLITSGNPLKLFSHASNQPIVLKNTPGMHFFWVEFKDANGKTDKRSVQIEVANSTYYVNLAPLSGGATPKAKASLVVVVKSITPDVSPDVLVYFSVTGRITGL